MPEGNEGLKYEGLVALMIGMEERIKKDSKERLDEFKVFADHRFTKLDEHNEWQNGSMHKMSERIHKAEHRIDEVSNGNKYVRLLKWIDTHPRRSIVMIIGAWTIASIAVTNAVCNNWLPRLWEVVINIVT